MSFVAVDGGQSELRLTVVGSGVTHRAPGFSYRGVDPVATMAEAVASAWASASADGLADDVERAALGAHRPSLRRTGTGPSGEGSGRTVARA